MLNNQNSISQRESNLSPCYNDYSFRQLDNTVKDLANDVTGELLNGGDQEWCLLNPINFLKTEDIPQNTNNGLKYMNEIRVQSASRKRIDEEECKKVKKKHDDSLIKIPLFNNEILKKNLKNFDDNNKHLTIGSSDENQPLASSTTTTTTTTQTKMDVLPTPKIRKSIIITSNLKKSHNLLPSECLVDRISKKSAFYNPLPYSKYLINSDNINENDNLQKSSGQTPAEFINQITDPLYLTNSIAIESLDNCPLKVISPYMSKNISPNNDLIDPNNNDQTKNSECNPTPSVHIPIVRSQPYLRAPVISVGEIPLPGRNASTLQLSSRQKLVKFIQKVNPIITHKTNEKSHQKGHFNQKTLNQRRLFSSDNKKTSRLISQNITKSSYMVVPKCTNFSTVITNSSYSSIKRPSMDLSVPEQENNHHNIQQEHNNNNTQNNDDSPDDISKLSRRIIRRQASNFRVKSISFNKMISHKKSLSDVVKSTINFQENSYNPKSSTSNLQIEGRLPSENDYKFHDENERFEIDKGNSLRIEIPINEDRKEDSGLRNDPSIGNKSPEIDQDSINYLEMKKDTSSDGMQNHLNCMEKDENSNRNKGIGENIASKNLAKTLGSGNFSSKICFMKNESFRRPQTARIIEKYPLYRTLSQETPKFKARPMIGKPEMNASICKNQARKLRLGRVPLSNCKFESAISETNPDLSKFLVGRVIHLSSSQLIGKNKLIKKSLQ